MIQTVVMAMIFVTGGLLLSPVAQPAFANDALDAACANDPNSVICKESANSASVQDLVVTIVNVLLYIIGVLAVIMIIIGGLRYTTSGGDSGALTSAKNTILYSIVGLLIAFFAYAIVNWVIVQFLLP